MKLKRVLIASAAVIVCGLSGQAQANDRLSLYEINAFVTDLTNAVNNPNRDVGRSFLQRKVSTNASFDESLNRTWYGDGRWSAGHYAYQASNGYYTSPHYRYPYAYNAYRQPVSYKSLGKNDLINQLDHKKSMIPRYHQTITTLGVSMPVYASSAVVDVRLKEFGLSYAMSPYGVYDGHKVEHSDARCALHLKKQNGEIQMTKLSCNTVLRAPF